MRVGYYHLAYLLRLDAGGVQAVGEHACRLFPGATRAGINEHVVVACFHKGHIDVEADTLWTDGPRR